MRARTRPPTPEGASTRQMALSAPCNSPNTPEAVTSSVATPSTVARMPDPRLLAFSSMVCTAPAACSPMMPLSWAVTAPFAASSPNASPAMATAITTRGAIEKIVK